ncbi:uncharacterized protein LODBEIA_P50620 [Lodderomyces beijingensis]|uniref:Piwi domain-containing protein n=1 Tax=Lodderomyces beijingensis TaxID=1775926 RepID=A0ABP0ZRQ5_9ASCO
MGYHSQGRGGGGDRGGARGRGRGGDRGGFGGPGTGAGLGLQKLENVKVSFTPKAEAVSSLEAINKYKKTFARQISEDPHQILLRHDYGVQGTAVDVATNFLKYTVTNFKLYVYFAEVEDQSDLEATKSDKSGKKDKIKKPLLTTKSALENYVFVAEPFRSKRSQIYYRDFNMMYATVPLPIEDVLKFPIPDRQVSVKIQYVKELNFSELMKISTLQTYTKDFQEAAEYTNALIAVIGSKILENQHVVGIGSNKFFLFDKSSPIENFQKGLLIALGTVVSVRCSFGKVRVNLNPTPGIFYKSEKSNGQPMNVIDLVQDYCQLASIPTEANFRSIQQFLKGVKVYRNYLKKRSGKAIQGFDFKNNCNTLKFENANGELTTVAAYFASKWGIKLKYPQLPLIQIGGTASLPMEVAYIVPNQRFKGEVYDTKTLINLTALRPMQKAKFLTQEQANILSKVDFGKIDDKFTRIPSRILPAPSIEYKGNKMVIYREEAFNGRNEKRKGVWNLEKMEYLKPPTGKSLYKFGVMVLRDKFFDRKRASLQEATELFFKELNRLGIKNSANFSKYMLDLDNAAVRDDDSMERELTKLFQKAKTQDKVDYMLVVLSNKDAKYYRAVKRVADLKVGVANSCVVIDNFIKKTKFGSFDMMVFAQVGMKVNLKLGGSNHKLSDASSKGLHDQNKVPLLILGADVTHPTGEQNEKAVSVASVVGSEDGIFNNFPGSFRVQTGGQEVISDIKEMVMERIANFRKKVGKLPSKVLFYRDGVSEGQYYTVLKEELTKVKAAFREYGKANAVAFNPKITFIVVVKRHQTRFVPLEENAVSLATKKTIASMSNDNVIPGTVVDRDITSIAYFDFYIQSQQALKGTGIPAHYYVLHDENNYTSDEIQRITYNLCHTFGRATKSVKVVPAAYYADLLCTRGRCYIGPTPREIVSGGSVLDYCRKKLGDNIAQNIQNTMFYI